QLLAQPCQRPRQARLHGAAGQPQGLGGLGLVQLEEIARADDLAILVTELVDRREQRCPRLAGEDRRLGRWSRIARPAILGGAEGETGSTPGRPPSVAGLV